MVAIKLHVGDDIRRIVLEDEQPAAEQYRELLDRIGELYPELQGRVRLAWRDEEGDAISVTTVGDYQEALAAYRRSEATALRLFATASTPATITRPQPTVPTPQPTVPTPQPPPQPAAAPKPAPAPEPAPKAAPAETHEDDDDGADSADEAEFDVGPPQFDNNGKRVHPFVTCDGCQGPVTGIRYKCAQCYDFDLCEKCEATEQHPRHHVLLKIRVPQRVQVWTPYARHHGRRHGHGRWRGFGGPHAPPAGPAGPWGHGPWGPGPWRHEGWGFGPFPPQHPGTIGVFGSGAGCGGGRRRGCHREGWSANVNTDAAAAPATASAPAAAPPASSAKTAAAPFENELRLLHEMGFVDDATNLELLRARRGRLEDVIFGLTQLNVNAPQ